MSRTDPKHGQYEDLGVQIRRAADLPFEDPRHDFANIPANKARAEALIKYKRSDGDQAKTEKMWKAYFEQFTNLSDDIRKLVRGTAAGEGMQTPQEIDKGSPAAGYFVVEWRIKLVNNQPDAAGCGCGCGCGCGG
jgi:hypothetical protein